MLSIAVMVYLFFVQVFSISIQDLLLSVSSKQRRPIFDDEPIKPFNFLSVVFSRHREQVQIINSLLTILSSCNVFEDVSRTKTQKKLFMIYWWSYAFK